MRATRFPRSLASSLVSSLLLLSSPAIAVAQDEFDDDFDSEPDDRGSRGAQGADESDDFDELEEELPEDQRLEGRVRDEAEPEEQAPAAAPATTDEARRAWRERRHVLHNTWLGPVGGFHVVDAGSGAEGAFRASLGLNFFFIDDWLTLPEAEAAGRSTSHSHIGGSLSLSWTPWEFLEIYASLASWANSNEQEDPALFQVLGDTLFGVKGNYRVLPFLYLGGDVSVGFLNTVGDIGLVGESTSVGIRLNGTADLRELASPIPLIARLNLQYWFDNSQALVNSVEQARYRALTDPQPCPGIAGGEGNCLEDRHLVTRVERYALQIDRVDRFTIGVGLEAPLTVMPDFTISPIAEWMLHIPVNRQGYSCLFIEGAPGMPVAGQDGCLDKQGFSAFEQTLTLGVRVMPPLRGLNVYAAVDIGLTGVNTFVRELSGQEPYNVMIGFGYAFDPSPPASEPREVVREVVRETPAAPKGRVRGIAIEQGAANPIAGAIVTFPGRELTALSTGAGGDFVSYEFDPGEIQINLAHPEYNETSCNATIAPEGGDVEVRCEMQALPRMGNLRGRVVGDGGAAVGGALVALSGPATRNLTTAPDGSFSTQDLPPGTYMARVEAENFLIKQDSFEIRPRETATPEITLVARPRQSLVQIRARQITIRRQVNFATDSAEILADSNQLLSEIADVIMRHPELTRIEVQGHTDNRGPRDHNVDLSQRRAEAVRDWLVRAGVAAGRLEARGYGPDQPLVPNITASNRARNRRVQFVIQDRTDEAPAGAAAQ